ncbi:MAG: hypothetical protein ABEK16_01780 [Candidatus Nanohalobium sp.]
MSTENENTLLIRDIARENAEGLAKLADEDEAGEIREHPFRHKLKRLYRRYVKKPEAKPVEV